MAMVTFQGIDMLIPGQRDLICLFVGLNEMATEIYDTKVEVSTKVNKSVKSLTIWHKVVFTIDIYGRVKKIMLRLSLEYTLYKYNYYFKYQQPPPRYSQSHPA